MIEYVQLVDEQDNDLGIMEKLAAHEQAKLHRALSVFVFNTKGAMLLQQRAIDKYHSGGLWTNTCCTHPMPKEPVSVAAQRRLQEEMGLHCALQHQFTFLYQADMGNGLVEHEFDHIFFGESDTLPQPNPDEVMDYVYMSFEDIKAKMLKEPEQFTAWFKLIIDKVKDLRNEHTA